MQLLAAQEVRNVPETVRSGTRFHANGGPEESRAWRRSSEEPFGTGVEVTQ